MRENDRARTYMGIPVRGNDRCHGDGNPVETYIVLSGLPNFGWCDCYLRSTAFPGTSTGWMLRFCEAHFGFVMTPKVMAMA